MTRKIALLVIVLIAAALPSQAFAAGMPEGQFILDRFWDLFLLFATAAMSVLVAIIWPGRLRVMGETIASNPVQAGGVGLLAVGVSLPLLVLISITLVLIPVSLAGFIILAAATAVGFFALSYEAGSRIASLTKQDWTPGLAAGVGAILLGIVFAGVDQVPCIGWAMQAAIMMIGLGAVVLTRFGGESFVVASEKKRTRI